MSGFNLYPVARELSLALNERDMRVALAESCTGGGMARLLTTVSGSSAWFDRGFVTYSNDAKIEMLGVQSSTIQQYGAVSEQTALEMAEGAIAHSRADIALSVTGVAGPSGGTQEKPVGTVWFALAHRNGKSTAVLKTFSGARHYVRRSAITFAVCWLLREVKK